MGKPHWKDESQLPLSMTVMRLSNIVERVNASGTTLRGRPDVLGVVTADAVEVRKLIFVVGVTILAIFVTHAITVAAFVRVQIVEDNAARHDTSLLQPFCGFLNFSQS